MRRVTEHTKVNFDGDELLVLVCYEEGVKKEQIKKENRFSKNHQILVRNGNRFEYLQKKA